MVPIRRSESKATTDSALTALSTQKEEDRGRRRLSPKVKELKGRGRGGGGGEW